jgi:hypothetical protein
MMEIGFIDPDGSTSDGASQNGVEIFTVELGSNPFGYTGETVTQRNALNFSILNDDNDAIIIDGFSAFANSMYYGNQGAYNSDWGYWSDTFLNDTTLTAFVNNYPGLSPTQKFFLKESLQFELYQQKNLLEILNQNRTPYQQLTTTAFSNTLEFENVIQQAFGKYRLFVQMYDEYDVRACTHDLTLLELLDPTDWTSTPAFKYKF